MDLNVKNFFAKRNIFDLSHLRTLTLDGGHLVPVMLEEVYPGDTYNCSTVANIRLSPQLAPLMHEVNVNIEYWHVPSRILMDDWSKFITGDTSGSDTTALPYMTSTAGTGYLPGSLPDYFGLPTGVAGFTHSALPFRAYNMIWNEWYRDQNLQSAVTISKGNGADTTTSLAVLHRSWEKDYFTTALPTPQRGAAVTLPLGTSANVTMNSTVASVLVRKASDGTQAPLTVLNSRASDGALAVTGTDSGLKLDPNGTLSADLSTATAASVNAVRLAFQLQRWAEKSMRGGSRLVETIFSHFGVRTSDRSLQRPEKIGAARTTIQFTEVLQTSETGTTPQGNMAGHGIGHLNDFGFKKSFEEHGYIIALLSVTPRTQYQNGLPRIWSRSTRFDYYWPEFANLGEQAVLNKEIHAGHASPSGVFGYVPRYEELRHNENTIHGMFRAGQPLNYWHMGRELSSSVALNDSFIQCVPRTDNFAVGSAEHAYYVQLGHKMTAVRPIPKIGTPGLIDHG